MKTFPWTPVLICCSCLIADLFALEMTYPFLVFMIQDFNLGSKNEGMYVGIVGSAFGIGQFISGFFWGNLSDKYGRKKPLMIGLLGNLIAMALFGLSKNIYMAAGLQFFQGIMNGNFGIIFTVIQDVYEGENLGRAFGYIGFAYGLGLSLSTGISGLTAQPAKKYPSVFASSEFFIEYPFFLPCLISACYIFVVFLVLTFLLPETQKRIKTTLKEEEMPFHEKLSLIQKENHPIQDEYIPSDKLWTLLTFILCGMMFLHWWGMFGFMQMLGVWTSYSVPKGGLGFNSLEIGIFFVCWGLYLFPYYIWIWPKLMKWRDSEGKALRIWTIVRIGLILDIIEFSLYPFLNNVANNRILLWILLQFVIIIGVIAINTYYLAIQMVINLSVIPKINGSINGLVTTCMALGKAIAPFTAGLLFSQSMRNSQFPIDFHLLFFVISISQLIIFVLSLIATHSYPKMLNLRVS